MFELTLRELQKTIVSFALVYNVFPNSHREFYELTIVLSVLNVKHTDIVKHFRSEEAYIEFYENSKLRRLENNSQLHHEMNRQAFLLWFYSLDADKARTEYATYASHVSDRIGDDWIRKIVNTMELRSDLT